MSSFKQYHTRTGANAGAELKLLNPAGKPTGDTIRVRGTDSDAFQAARGRMRQALLGYLEEHGLETKSSEEYRAFTAQEQLKLQASLVMSWSFEEACTIENVIELFSNAPDVADQVDTFAGKRDRFVSALPTSCEPSPTSRSDLPSQPRPGPKSRGANT